MFLLRALRGILSSFVQFLTVPEASCQWLHNANLRLQLCIALFSCCMPFLCVPLNLGSTQLIQFNLPCLLQWIWSHLGDTPQSIFWGCFQGSWTEDVKQTLRCRWYHSMGWAGLGLRARQKRERGKWVSTSIYLFAAWMQTQCGLLPHVPSLVRAVLSVMVGYPLKLWAKTNQSLPKLLHC